MDRFLALLVKLIGGVLALALLAYLAVNIADMVKARSKRATIEKELTGRLAQALPRATAFRDAVRAQPGFAEPEASWISQVCDFPTSDAGWTVSSYLQECQLHTTLLYRFASPEEVRRAARSLPAELIGEALPVSGRSECPALARAGEAFGAQEVGADLRSPAQDGVGCQMPAQPGRQRVLAGTRIGAVTDGHWLHVYRREQLQRTDIGCTHWSILFCGNPFGDKPAWGTAPGR